MKPIEVGRYRLWNGRVAIVRKLDTVNGVRIATGCIQDADAERPMEWNGDGGLFGDDPGPWDLVERIDTATEPVAHEDLPPALNSAVKAAEDRVRALKQMVDETQAAWATACRLHEAAQRELERMEKDCEVRK